MVNSSLTGGHSSLNAMGMDIDGMGGVGGVGGSSTAGPEAMDTEELLQVYFLTQPNLIHST